MKIRHSSSVLGAGVLLVAASMPADPVSFAEPQNPPPHRCSLSILFVGNSYTFYNDLPGMFKKVVESNSKIQCAIFVDSFTAAGKRLDETWDLPGAREKLASRPWDYVILQNHSLSFLNVPRMEQGFQEWASHTDAHVFIIETWARKSGSYWYDPRNAVNLKSYEDMSQQIVASTRKVADDLKLDIVPVGEVRAAANRDASTPDLYDPDGHHPSPAGSLLEADTIKRSLFGLSPEDTTYVPPGVSPDAARELQEIAAGGAPKPARPYPIRWLAGYSLP